MFSHSVLDTHTHIYIYIYIYVFIGARHAPSGPFFIFRTEFTWCDICLFAGLSLVVVSTTDDFLAGWTEEDGLQK
jgi:hypothetical protein